MCPVERIAFWRRLQYLERISNVSFHSQNSFFCSSLFLEWWWNFIALPKETGYYFSNLLSAVTREGRTGHPIVPPSIIAILIATLGWGRVPRGSANAHRSYKKPRCDLSRGIVSAQSRTIVGPKRFYCSCPLGPTVDSPQATWHVQILLWDTHGHILINCEPFLSNDLLGTFRLYRIFLALA